MWWKCFGLLVIILLAVGIASIGHKISISGQIYSSYYPSESYGSSGSKQETAPKCSETDKGNDYLTAGTTTVSGQAAETDYCLADGRTLVEQFCSGDAKSSASFDCSALGESYACKDGACAYSEDQKETGQCTDSDNGLNYNVKGIVVYKAADTAAVLTDSCAGKNLIEYYCENNVWKDIGYMCEYGCENGACLEKSQQAAGGEGSETALSAGGENIEAKKLAQADDDRTLTAERESELTDKEKIEAMLLAMFYGPQLAWDPKSWSTEEKEEHRKFWRRASEAAFGKKGDDEIYKCLPDKEPVKYKTESSWLFWTNCNCYSCEITGKVYDWKYVLTFANNPCGNIPERLFSTENCEKKITCEGPLDKSDIKFGIEGDITYKTKTHEGGERCFKYTCVKGGSWKGREIADISCEKALSSEQMERLKETPFGIPDPTKKDILNKRDFCCACIIDEYNFRSHSFYIINKKNIVGPDCAEGASYGKNSWCSFPEGIKTKELTSPYGELILRRELSVYYKQGKCEDAGTIEGLKGISEADLRKEFPLMREGFTDPSGNWYPQGGS